MTVKTHNIRAIEIPATEQHNSINVWFHTDDEMRQFLANRQTYANVDGMIKDDTGLPVGIWYYAEFSAKYPEFVSPEDLNGIPSFVYTNGNPMAKEEAEDRNEDMFDCGCGNNQVCNKCC